jgi:hypothetical protein
MLDDSSTRRHVYAALKLAGTVEEIMEFRRICVAFGVHASNLAVPILAEALRRLGEGPLSGG